MRRRDLTIYGLTLALSLLAHLGLFGGLGHAARRHVAERRRVIEVAVVSTPLPAEEPRAPEPEKPKPKPPAPKPIDLTKVPPQQLEQAPPPTPSEPPPPEPPRPVFGVSMRSTVGPGSGSGMAVRVGNTLMKDPEAEYTPPEDVKAYRPLHEVTKLPRKKGECNAEYSARAKELRIEGQVKLEVEVGADGAVGQVRVVRGLGHGLDEAAVAAIKRCRFAPGEVAGLAVPTRIPYTYTFIIED